MMSSGVISVFIGMLPAMKTTEPYSPSARAKASAKPVSQAGSEGGQDDAEERLAAAGAEAGRRLLHLGVEALEHGLQGAHHEGQADEDERDGDAERREGDLDPERARAGAPSQPFGA